MNATLQIDHDGPTPDGTVALRVLLRIHGEPPTKANRVPLHVSLVLDRSGSMAGEKLAAARDAAAGLVHRLWPEDMVSVVAYDDEVVVVAEPDAGARQQDLTRRIGAIEAGGSTNLSGGWLMARKLAATVAREGCASRVLLLTDGLANVGITEPDTLAGLFRKAAEEGITTSTIGFGTDYNERLLLSLANAGRGNMHYIEQPERAAAVFADELEGLLSLAAQNVTVTVSYGPATRLAAVHHSYPRRKVAVGLELAVGDLYAREPRALLVEIIGHATAPDPVEIAAFTIEGDVLLSDGSIEHRTLQVPVRLSAAEGPVVDVEVRRELLLQATARARDEALERQSKGDYRGAADALRSTAERLREAGIADAQLEEEAADLDAMAAQMSTGRVAEADRKYLAQSSYNTSRSRSRSTETFRRKRSGPTHP